MSNKKLKEALGDALDSDKDRKPQEQVRTDAELSNVDLEGVAGGSSIPPCSSFCYEPD
ncbi:hypothetical protein NX784_18395 [Massilia pinisoli]|uniref:Uncharacterized protein n=1 Tax=Massilia pinisoli TaxID=1772194 RepID=A0ABT1ZUF2_9BURK|nr:hypothetical protein [Massilia pinisoli]MCS0583565.1 hypothetical protein [Massilia pinisoli]